MKDLNLFHVPSESLRRNETRYLPGPGGTEGWAGGTLPSRREEGLDFQTCKSGHTRCKRSHEEDCTSLLPSLAQNSVRFKASFFNFTNCIDTLQRLFNKRFKLSSASRQFSIDGYQNQRCVSSQQDEFQLVIDEDQPVLL